MFQLEKSFLTLEESMKDRLDISNAEVLNQTLLNQQDIQCKNTISFIYIASHSYPRLS